MGDRAMQNASCDHLLGAVHDLSSKNVAIQSVLTRMSLGLAGWCSKIGKVHRDI